MLCYFKYPGAMYQTRTSPQTVKIIILYFVINKYFCTVIHHWGNAFRTNCLKQNTAYRSSCFTVYQMYSSTIWDCPRTLPIILPSKTIIETSALLWLLFKLCRSLVIVASCYRCNFFLYEALPTVRGMWVNLPSLRNSIATRVATTKLITSGTTRSAVARNGASNPVLLV